MPPSMFITISSFPPGQPKSPDVSAVDEAKANNTYAANQLNQLFTEQNLKVKIFEVIGDASVPDPEDADIMIVTHVEEN